MDAGGNYGSHPEYLPRFMTDRRSEAERHVLVLDHADSRQLEAESLNRFPVRNSCELDWSAAPYLEQRWCADDDAWVALITELLTSYIHADTDEESLIVVFWENFAIPTVALPTGPLLRYAREIQDAEPHFRLYPLDGDVLIECLPDGKATIASIPPPRPKQP